MIPPGEEAQRLGALPVQVLSPSAEILETLERWGVRTCAACSLPLLELSERLGKRAFACTIGARRERAFAGLAEAELCFRRRDGAGRFRRGTRALAFLLGRLLDQLCARLAARSLAANAIRVRFELEPLCKMAFSA